MSSSTDPARPARTPPTVVEIAALTARLRDLSARGRTVDPAERAVFLADKQALLDRITDAATDDRLRGRAQYEAEQALSEVALARAAGPGYVLLGPSSRTWLRDPATGQPTAPVSQAEHRAVRELLGRDVLDTTEPEWVTGTDGLTDVHSTVILTDNEPDHYADDHAGADEVPARDDVAHPDGVSGPGRVHSQPAPAHGGDPALRWEMPAWMRQQAARAQAEHAAGTAPAMRPDDPAELAARVAALREQITARTAALSEHTTTAEGEQARREQLTRWHHDYTDTDTVHDSTSTDHGDDQGDDGLGWSW